MTLLREPLLTKEMAPDDLTCEPGATYFFASGPEERSDLEASWMDRQQNVEFVELNEISADEIQIRSENIRLRDRSTLKRAASLTESLYIDITGMTYSMWAPILGAALAAGVTCRVVYREPLDYRRSSTPTRGMIYDLSEKIAGISPIPGMASIRLRHRTTSVLVPLLGFEGPRFAHVLDSTEPQAERVVPIVGAPGFRAEYAAQALLANRLSLQQEGHYSRVLFAKANCPFDLFHRLAEIQSHFQGALLRVAPVGTKPHGLGAVLFALGRPGAAEIVYDHPLRKARRTTGSSRVCVYEVSLFAQSDIFHGEA